MPVDSRSIAFLEVMIALGVIGILAFLVFLISRFAMQNRAKTTPGKAVSYTPQWYEFLLAAIIVIIAAILFLWQFPPGGRADWGEDARSMTFFVIMMIICALGIIVFLLTIFWRLAHRPKEVLEEGLSGALAVPTAPAAAPEEAPKASHESPSAVRLLGLLGFIVAFLILNWVWVPAADQYFLMLNLIYPAGLVVALVLLFDKVNRAWNVKLPGEVIREWFYLDAILFLYILGYLNLRQSGGGEAYAALFWDVVQVVGFLFVFWIIDRKTSSLRFLLTHIYFLALPILLLIWRTVQDVKIVPDISWWSTIWPFFALAAVFLVLELIILIVNRENDNQTVGTVKDVIFLILYVILLIAARPEVAAT
jgi:MFS family permease